MGDLLRHSGVGQASWPDWRDRRFDHLWCHVLEIDCGRGQIFWRILLLRSQAWDSCIHAWSNLTSRWTKSSVNRGVQNAQSVGALLPHHSAQSYGSGLAQEKKLCVRGYEPNAAMIHRRQHWFWSCNFRRSSFVFCNSVSVDRIVMVASRVLGAAAACVILLSFAVGSRK